MADPGLTPVVRLAPAKLNLTLAVTGLRPDGFHALHTVMAPLELADRLSLSPAASSGDTLRVQGLHAGPAADNLVLRAIAATRDAVGRAADAFPLAVRLEKRTPVAAGLGGGSSDAAAAFDGALSAWRVPVEDRAELARRVAPRVGSDVPFFLAGSAALVEGRGEVVTPLAGVRGEPPGVLLVTPAVPASTPAVFAAFDAGGPGAPSDRGSTRLSSEHLASELRVGLDVTQLLARAGVLAAANDLIPAASVVVPGLTSLRRGLTRLLGRPVGLSGSGPTLWLLYPDAEAATSAATTVGLALDDGRLVAPGDARPSIIATTLARTIDHEREAP